MLVRAMLLKPKLLNLLENNHSKMVIMISINAWMEPLLLLIKLMKYLHFSKTMLLRALTCLGLVSTT